MESYLGNPEEDNDMDIRDFNIRGNNWFKNTK